MLRFGEKLHTLRVAHELTLQQMAAELGYATHACISELESGKKLGGQLRHASRVATWSTGSYRRDCGADRGELGSPRAKALTVRRAAAAGSSAQKRMMRGALSASGLMSRH